MSSSFLSGAVEMGLPHQPGTADRCARGCDGRACGRAGGLGVRLPERARTGGVCPAWTGSEPEAQRRPRERHGNLHVFTGKYFAQMPHVSTTLLPNVYISSASVTAKTTVSHQALQVDPRHARMSATGKKLLKAHEPRSAANISHAAELQADILQGRRDHNMDNIIMLHMHPEVVALPAALPSSSWKPSRA